MKTIFSILIILIFAKHSLALKCIAYDTSNTDESELSYKCEKGSKYCETLVSKVEGSYSVILSCSTDEKCDAEPILKNGLDECSHDEDNTECYSCCKDNDCNTLEEALKNLPDDVDIEKPAKKGKKLKSKKADDEEEDEEQNDENIEESEDEENEDLEEIKDEKKKSKGTKNKKSKNNDEESDSEKVETDEEPEENEEPEEEDIDNEESDESLTNSNATAVVENKIPENETVIDEISIDNKTVEAINVTTNATVAGTENNSDTDNVLTPLDPNIQEIENALNDTEVVDLGDGLDNVGNAENIENENMGLDLETDEDNTANNAIGMEETDVQGGVEFNAPEDDLQGDDANSENNTNGESNIITEGENANEAGEQNELFDAPSSSTKYQISEILLSAALVLVLIQLF